MGNPVPVNSTATTVNKAIDGVFTVGVGLAETAIKAEVPFLALPIISTIFDWLLKMIANKIYQYFALFVTFEIIDVQVSGQVSDSQKALAALKAAQAKGDPVEIAKALKDFNDATDHLTHWDGGANPGSL